MHVKFTLYETQLVCECEQRLILYKNNRNEGITFHAIAPVN
jgi:hypothetical protein